MRCLLFLFALLALAGCGRRDQAGRPSAAVAQAAADTIPAGWQPEAFLDSVGRLPAAPLVASITHEVDSAFTHLLPSPGRVVSAVDLALLRRASRTGFISVRTARRVFGDTSITRHSNWMVADEDAVKKGLVLLRLVAFGGDEYALCVGASGHPGAAMYFFKGRRLIARHKTTYFYGESLRHYRDAEGRAVVYYLYELLRGSNNWWNQYFFYRYEGDQLVPVLSELQNGNLSGFREFNARNYWLEATVQKTRPLTLKMVYHVEMPDTARAAPSLVNDSTLVEYRWNPATQRLEGQYAASKITRLQVLSYCAANSTSDLLFIVAYYTRLKQALADPAQRPATRRYLWIVQQGLPRR